jgi:hypothetical protein
MVQLSERLLLLRFLFFSWQQENYVVNLAKDGHRQDIGHYNSILKTIKILKNSNEEITTELFVEV